MRILRTSFLLFGIAVSVAGRGGERQGVLVVDYGNEIWRIDLESGVETVPLHNGPGAHPVNKWSYASMNAAGDGSLIEWLYDPKQFQDFQGTALHFFEPSGRETKVVLKNMDVNGRASASPDGALLAFQVRSREGSSTQLTRRDGTPVIFYGARTDPNWLPDGRLVMCGKAGIEIIGPPFMAGKRTAFIHQSGDFVENCRVSPDGSRVAFRSKTGVSMIRVDGSDLHVVVSGEWVAFPVWSPDGAFLAVSVAAERGWGKAKTIWTLPADARGLSVSSPQLHQVRASRGVLQDLKGTVFTSNPPAWGPSGAAMLRPPNGAEAIDPIALAGRWCFYDRALGSMGVGSVQSKFEFRRDGHYAEKFAGTVTGGVNPIWGTPSSITTASQSPGTYQVTESRRNADGSISGYLSMNEGFRLSRYFWRVQGEQGNRTLWLEEPAFNALGKGYVELKGNQRDCR